MTTWLRQARSAGLSAEEIEAIYRTAFRDNLADGAEGVA
jgi:hypothetical protein